MKRCPGSVNTMLRSTGGASGFNSHHR